MTIKTDHKWKEFKFKWEVPNRVLKEFDYLGEDDIDGFFKYRNRWYHLSEFMTVKDTYTSDAEMQGWHAYLSDSYFSGIVIKISNDGELYQVGTYVS